MRERQLEQPGVAEFDAVLAGELGERPRLQVAELETAGAGSRVRRGTPEPEQPLQPGEEREARGRGSRPARAAAPAAAAATAGPPTSTF